MGISDFNKSSETVTSTDVRKPVIMSEEVPEIQAKTSNISVLISAKQTLKSYSDTRQCHYQSISC